MKYILYVQVEHFLMLKFGGLGLGHTCFQEGRIPKLYKTLLPGREKVPLFLLADPAYPLLPDCRKEYSTCYNNAQCACAYGRLKARLSILIPCINFSLDDIPVRVYTCFVLHNYCEINKVGIDEM
ncbi:unnamed protein product [Porites lobata]|uniref:DDE Tnp4 domain-containing protein n=1 Tax=Porites lobata TaxID=104759 RepID=A0ABN8R752_9CNID|nr:unnamed protein product [Porites lobata]